MLVFLGNTGRRYERTRHNAAWMVLERSPFSAVEGWQQKFKALWSKTSIGGASVVLLKPQTMMNLSGESVQAATRFFRFDAGEVMVVHDDVELPFGQVSVRFGGGLAGHNGLRSIAHCLGTRDFWRARIGIGRPPFGDLHGHVLGRFTAEEEAELPDVLDWFARALADGVRSGFGTG